MLVPSGVDCSVKVSECEDEYIVLDSIGCFGSADEFDDTVDDVVQDDVPVDPPVLDNVVSGSSSDDSSRDSDREADKVCDNRILWIGDSLVRFVDREFCGVDRTNRTRLCLPGARIDDVCWQVDSMCRDQDVVVVSVGTNDVPYGSLDSIRRSYKELLFRLKETGCKVVVVGLLPRRGSASMLHMMVVINSWLESICRLFGFEFVDFWSKFDSRPDRFMKDGLHLTREGARVLARGVNGKVKDMSLN